MLVSEHASKVLRPVEKVKFLSVLYLKDYVLVSMKCCVKIDL